MYTYEEALNNSIKYFNGNELSAKVFLDKYALRDSNNKILEDTPDKMHRRLAKEFARIEKNKFEKPLNEEEIYTLFKNFSHIIPQGSPCFAIGNNYQIASASNCFVLESPEDSYGGICKTDEELVQISKRRGGVGIDLSKLRPKGSATNNSSRSSTGIKSWMTRYSNSIREVGQSGRRGALMLTVSVHHPDILDFITAKNNGIDITGANISVRLTDEFLKAVENNKEYELRFPVDSKNVVKTISANEIWNLIIDNAWSRAEPGILFWDNILKESIPDCYEEYKTISTNPSLRKGTLILTSEGPRRIETLENSEFQVYNLNHSYSKAVCKLSGKNQELYEVELSSCFKYYATKEHRWATNNGEKTTLELLPGDKIPILKKDKVFNGNLGTREDGFLIGWFLGDGWLTVRKDNNKNQYGFIISEKDKNSKIGDIILSKLRQIGFNGEWIERSRENAIWYEINTQNSKLEDYFNLFYNPCKNKGISKELLEKSSEEFIKGLVDGYLSSDGSIDEKRQKITFVSKNKKLLEDFSEIFGFYGIRSSIRSSESKSSFPNGKNYNKKYKRNDLYISDSDSIKHFQKLFNLSLDYKEEKLRKMLVRKSNNINYVKVKNVNKTDLKEDVWDITVNDNNNCFSLSHCITHNCGEITLSANDSCRLLVINLMNFVRYPFDSNAYFDFMEFYQSAQIAQRLMDDIVDLELEKIDTIIQKIKKDPEDILLKRTELNLWQNIERACEFGRRTGLGITALGDTIAACGIKYGSDESIEFTEKVYKTLKFGSYRSSVDMSKELGSFPAWNWENEKNNPFLLRIKNEFLYLAQEDLFEVPFPYDSLLNGEDLYNDIAKYGRRNIANLTTAPVGSLSILASYLISLKRLFNTTSGIEPLYSWKPFTKRKKGNPGDNDFRTDFIDQSGDHWMDFDVFHSGITAFLNKNPGSTVEDSPYYGGSAEEIVWTQRVKLQAAAQKHVDHSISSTVNLPENVSKEEVDKIYREAWKSGCKGITVYRDGCRTGVLIKKEEKLALTNATKRPKSLSCDIYNISVTNNKYTVVVGLLNGNPYEVFCVANFIDKHKHGELVKAGKGKYVIKTTDGELELSDYLEDDTQNALLRMVSTSLRHGASIKFVIEQLQKTKGDLTSFTKCVARALKKYIQDGDGSSEKCECGNQLIYQEGCLTCKSCGYSKCN